MKLKLSFFLKTFFIFAVVAGFGVSSAFAATIVVNANDDQINADSTCSFREAWQAAETNQAVGGCIAGDDQNGPDTIDLSGLSGSIDLQNGELVVKQDVNVVGPGSGNLVLNGVDSTHRLFSFEKVTPHMVSLQGFTVTHFGLNNSNEIYGGAIFETTGDHLDLSDIHFVKNTAPWGGAIANLGGTLSMSEVTFLQNEANIGGAIMNDLGDVQIHGSLFTTNHAALAGALENITGTILLDASTLDHNSADNLAGGICNEDGHITFSYSTISNNLSGKDAGGIYNTGHIDAVNSTMSDNKAVGYVGGLYDDTDGTVSLTHVTIANNLADLGGKADDAGAGLYQETSTDSVEIHNSIIANNKAGAQSDKISDCKATVNATGVNILTDTSVCINAIPNSPAEALTQADPLLKPLAFNDPGSTATIALDAQSPAIDKIDASDNSAGGHDQREEVRPQGSKIDVGAFEYVVGVDGPAPQGSGGQNNGGAGGNGGAGNNNGGSGNGFVQSSAGGSDISNLNTNAGSGNNGAADGSSNNSSSSGSGAVAPQPQPQPSSSGSGSDAQNNNSSNSSSDTNYVGAGSASQTAPFTDISGNFAEQDIIKLYNDCQVKGYSDANGKLLNLFRPNMKITRAELITMLVKCRFGEQTALSATDAKPFADVPQDHYAAAYIAKAKAEKIISGYEDGNFYPNRYTSRAEAAKMIELTWFGQDKIDAAPSEVGMCTDLSRKAWYLPFLNFALANGLMSGYNDANGNALRKCGPNNFVTRAETAKIIIHAKEFSTK